MTYEITQWNSNNDSLRIVLDSEGRDICLDYDEQGQFEGGFARPLTLTNESELVNDAAQYIERHIERDDWFMVKMGHAIEAVMTRRFDAT